MDRHGTWQIDGTEDLHPFVLDGLPRLGQLAVAAALRSEVNDDGSGLEALDFEDEIIAATCIAHDGEVRDESTREALSESQETSEERR